MSTVNSSRGKFAIELKETMTGADVLIGILLHTPVHIIFDNLGDAEVVISVFGEEWKTFGPGTAVILDCRANHGYAMDFTFDKGTSFYGNGASGEFSIAYTYAQEL